MQNRPLVIAAILAGVVLIALAILYWAEPASSLPSFIPGHGASRARHVKHGIAAFVLGLGAFVLAWFQSAPSRTASETS